MSKALVVFEDAHWRDLRPLTDLAPVPALAFGASSLTERLANASGLPLAAIAARPGALAACRTMPAHAGAPEPSTRTLVFVNAAALSGAWLRELVVGDDSILVRQGDRILGARVDVEAGRAMIQWGDVETRLAGAGLPEKMGEARLLERPWQVIEWNAEAIAADLVAMAGAMRGDVHASVAVLGDGRVSVEAGARVDPYCVIDARNGPVLVRRRALVGPHTVIVGPCVVGEGTQLLGGSVARSTFGRQCRVAGEVEECVWQGFGNKRHHGFVGHSLIGEWVNLGALTTTSDLKNNYGKVRVTVDGEEHDTGSMKVGALVGAHVKTGIGTLLPTGAVVGTGANLFGGGRFAPKTVPSFGWWNGDSLVEHRLDAFTKTAQMALSRREERASVADEEAWKSLFEATQGERVG